jgi:hypothetical protein
MTASTEKILATFSYSPDIQVEPFVVVQMLSDGKTLTDNPDEALAVVCLNHFGFAFVADPEAGYLRRLH